MEKIIVEYSDIMRRQIAFSESYQKNNSVNCRMCYKQAENAKNRGNVIRFLKECGSSTVTITEYFKDAIDLMEDFPGDGEIERVFCDEIVTRLPNENGRLHGLHLEEYVMESSLPDALKKEVRRQIVKNKVVDRILENHTRIQREFNISKFLSENWYTANKEILFEKICETVDLFNMKPYGKLNAAIEEATYLFQKTGLSYNEERMVDRMTNYFLMEESLTENDIKDIHKVVTENHCISCTGEKRKYPAGEILSNYMNSCNKSTEGLHETVDSILALETVDVIRGFKPLLEFFRTVFVKKHSLSPIITDATIENMMESFQKHSDDIYYRDLLENTYKDIDTEVGLSEMYLGKFDEEVSSNMLRYRDELLKLKENVTNEMDFVYGSNNLSIMMEETIITIPLNEFKLVLAVGVLKACKKAGKIISGALRRLKEKTAGRIKAILIKNKQQNVQESLYDMLDENHCVDYCVATLDMDTSSGLSECHTMLQELCDTINEELRYDTPTMKAYYMIRSETAEIHLKNNYKVILTEQEKEEFRKTATSEDIDSMMKTMRIQEIVSDIDPEMNICEKATKVFSENPDPELFGLFMESCEIMGIDKSIVESIESRIELSNERNIDFVYPARMRLSEYSPVEEVPIDICMEAYSIMQSIFMDTIDGRYLKEDNNNVNKVAGTEKKVKELQQKKEDEKLEKKEETKSKVSPITTIKLYMQGLKKKIRDLTSKEKQIVNNADASFNRLARSCKDALTSDRRESIIKGSVIPSFSKSCKLAVALAGIARIASPATALVTGIAGLVASKHLTKKERALLLDEIDVELEMIEKEIQLAESKNQMKKLRKLMLIRKDMQREYQAIKLNMKTKTDVMPLATGGRKEYH